MSLHQSVSGRLSAQAMRRAVSDPQQACRLTNRSVIALVETTGCMP